MLKAVYWMSRGSTDAEVVRTSVGGTRGSSRAARGAERSSWRSYNGAAVVGGPAAERVWSLVNYDLNLGNGSVAAGRGRSRGLMRYEP
jgi:hypothetical protein